MTGLKRRLLGTALAGLIAIAPGAALAQDAGNGMDHPATGAKTMTHHGAKHHAMRHHRRHHKMHRKMHHRMHHKMHHKSHAMEAHAMDKKGDKK